jgi:hypothetical protein
MSNLTLQLEATDRSRDERAEVAVKVFELSQDLASKRLTADVAEKRELIEFLFLNLKLDGVSLFPEMVEGPFISANRGERI